jgi:hypothetical protein
MSLTVREFGYVLKFRFGFAPTYGYSPPNDRPGAEFQACTINVYVNCLNRCFDFPDCRLPGIFVTPRAYNAVSNAKEAR